MSNKITEIANKVGLKIAALEAPINSDPATWAKLSTDKNGAPHKSVDNLATIFENDPKYSSLCYCEHSSRVLWQGELIEDYKIEIIRRDIEIRYFLSRPSSEIERIALMVAHTRIVEPIKDYLLDLEWDKEPRIANLLRDVVHAEIPKGAENLIAEISQKWLISCVARILNPGCKMDNCLILVGNKGMWKSTFFKVLFGNDLVSDSPLAIGKKDGYEKLHQSGAWIWELAEMDSLQGRSAATTKQFLTSSEDTYRPSYGRLPVRRKRRTVFVATTNDFQFLSDGPERRFWTIRITKPIDLAYIREHREKLLAEAVHLYKQDVPWWLDYKQEQKLALYQSTFIIDDPWAMSVVEKLEKDANAMLKTTTADLMQAIGILPSQQHVGNAKRIAQICRDSGYEQKSSRRMRYWKKTK